MESFIEWLKYYDGGNVFNQLRIGEEIKLKRNYGNHENKHAVKVLTIDDILILYVAGVYSRFLSKVLENKNDYVVSIKRLLPNVISQMEVQIGIYGQCDFKTDCSLSSSQSPKFEKELIFNLIYKLHLKHTV